MAQFVEKKINKKSKKKINHDSEAPVMQLGQAPNDIYELDNELKQIQLQEETKYEPQTPTYVEYNDITEARVALEKGQRVRYILPSTVTPLEIVATAKSFGLPTAKLVNVLGSSMIIKKLIYTYVKDISVHKNHGGYMKHCTQVTPLTPNDQLMPRVKIKLNLDYDTYYTKDEQFEAKLTKELCDKVFKCPHENVKIIRVSEGSIDVFICFKVLAAFAVANPVTAGVAVGVAVGIAVIGGIAYAIHCRNKANAPLLAGGGANVVNNVNVNVRRGGGANSNVVNAPVHGRGRANAPAHTHDEDQLFFLEQKVLVRAGSSSQWDQEGVVCKLFAVKGQRKKVTIEYGDGKQERFLCSDSRLHALEDGQDPTMDGCVFIKNRVYIEMQKY
eukprot:893397_1